MVTGSQVETPEVVELVEVSELVVLVVLVDVVDDVEVEEVVDVGAVVAMQEQALEYFETSYVVGTKVGRGLLGPCVNVEQNAAALSGVLMKAIKRLLWLQSAAIA
jgi:hypothetical protein